MSSAYTSHSDICARFYQLTLDAENAAQFIIERSSPQKGSRALFVGSMFDIAACLIDRGLDVTIVDYSEEMVSLGRERFPDIEVLQADLAKLPFVERFDLIYVVGRVFTHMISNESLRSALSGCQRSLVSGGALFFDNYEDSKITRTNYFNGRVSGALDGDIIHRDSSTIIVSNAPFVVEWKANYHGVFHEEPFEFSDSMEHRAWSRGEIRTYLDELNFSMLSQGDNFDETSFYTFARKTT